MAMKKKSIGKVVFVDKPGPERIVETIKEIDRPVPIVTEKIVTVEVPSKVQAISHRYEVDKFGRTRWEIAPGEWGAWIPRPSAGGVSAPSSSGSGGPVTIDAAQFAALLADIGSRDWTLDFAVDQADVTGSVVGATQSGAWSVGRTWDLDFATDQVDATGSVVGAIQSGAWTVALDAPTLAALETITVNQGTSPWVVSGTVAATQSGAWTVALDGPTLAALETIELGAATLAALETITVLQGTSPWVVSGSVTTTLPTVLMADDTANPTIPQSASFNMVFDGATWDRQREPTADDMAVTGIPASGNQVFDGATWDRMRAANAAAGTTGIGVPAAGTLIFDTALGFYDRWAVVVGDGQPKTGIGAVNGTTYNGTTFDRIRSCAVLGMQGVGGAEAHDAPVTGHPVLTAGRASQIKPTDVSADGDVTRLWTTRAGRKRVYASGRRRLGLYHANLGNTTVTLAADAATAGRFWLVNTSSTVVAAIRRIYFSSVSASALVTLTIPNFNVERITFTGTPSGATVTPCLRDSSDAAATATIRTAATGMVITAGAVAHAFQTHSVLTAVGETRPNDQMWPIEAIEEEFLILRQNQGIVIRQATAGTSADTRSVRLDITWEEYNLTDFDIRD